MSVDDYCNIYDICVKLKMKPGESMEQVVIAYMEAKGKKPIATDLTKDEIIKQLTGDGKKLLSIETDEDGEQDIRFIEGEDNG